MCVGGKAITGVEFADVVQRSRIAVESAQSEVRGQLTYFEVLTALAFRHLAESGAGWAVIEAGMGGVCDATNVFEARQVRLFHIP